MNKQLRKAVIAGNWKMNKTPSQTTALVEEMKPLVMCKHLRSNLSDRQGKPDTGDYPGAG